MRYPDVILGADLQPKYNIIQDKELPEYDYDYHYDYDYAEEDKEQCLQSCLQKSRMIDHAVGCNFRKAWGQCIFKKSGTIVGASGISETGTCWRFHSGKKYSMYDYWSKSSV